MVQKKKGRSAGSGTKSVLKGPQAKAPGFASLYNAAFGRVGRFSNQEVVEFARRKRLNFKKVLKTSFVAFDVDHIAKTLSLSHNTVKRYKQVGKDLDSHQKEISLLVANLYALGVDELGSCEYFESWLQKKSPSLGEMPVNMLDTATGIGMVEAELLNMVRGDLAL